MAARWGAGEETVTACNMDFFPIETLDQTAGLCSGETLEVFQSCLDPSILSIFEDTPTVETKGLDEENEATLLTALTEILDNVDDETLSPFDILPDSDLLSNQKGREHSPLRRMLCLSRSSQEKDSICSTRPLSTGKSLSRSQTFSLQRSDGEEEEDCSLTLSPDRHSSYPEHGQLDWEGLSLPLPVTLEEGGDDGGLSVSLGDFVRHMHPYCMTICVENEHGEQMLPEGGIVLEVVDQGENGEPILAIQNMDFPISVPYKDLPTEKEQKDSDKSEEVATDSSEHIIVDDDDDDLATVCKDSVKTVAPVTPGLCSEVKDEIVLKQQKEDIKRKNPSQRKMKKKCKEQKELRPAEGRVLRSAVKRETEQELPEKLEKEAVREEKRVVKIPLPSGPSSSLLKSKQTKQRQTESKTQQQDLNGKISTSSPAHDTVLISASPEEGQLICSAAAVSSQQTCEVANTPVTAQDKVEGSSAAPSIPISAVSSESSAAAPSSESPEIPFPVSMAPAVPEPKPKSLSLEEYRRLRQQKKPAPVEKHDDSSTKWPSLPELPKELPPIPCLPNPNPKDPRRAIPQATKKEVEEVRPAWQPKGPGAPPTPEALLVPPAYMISSSSKVAAAATSCVPKPQQTQDPSRQPPKAPTQPTNPWNNLDTHSHTTAQPAVASLKPTTPHMSTGTKPGVSELLPSQSVFPEAVQLSKISPVTTTDVISSTTGFSAPYKTTVVPQEVPEVTASTSLKNGIINDSKITKPTVIGKQSRSSDATLPLDSHRPATQPDVLQTKKEPTTAVKPQKIKSTTQELIEAFTSEIGIEACDLTSLLEQFEETQAKEEQCVPEVSGRAAAVGNLSAEMVPEKTVVERVRANDLSSTAALTPPATPPHQMWKPLAPVTLLGRNKAPEASKSSPAKVIQIEAQPLPPVRSRSKPTVATTTVAPDLACMDHDYCLPNKGTSTGEAGKRWNVRQQSSITIKPIKQNVPTTTQTSPPALTTSSQSTTNHVAATKMQNYLLTRCLEKMTNDEPEESSVLDTPNASPSRQESESTFKVENTRRGPLRRSYRQHVSSRSQSPTCSPKERIGGRSRKRRSHRSPSPTSSCSDSYSSRSRSPERKRYRPRNLSSSSCSSRSSSRSSPSLSRSPPRRRRHSYSSSRSGSWSRSRSRSRSPQRLGQWGRSRQLYSPSYSHGTNIKMEEIQRRKEKAIEERRVVYVGRIRGTMTQKELRERFSLFGEIEECTLHFRDHGDNYGFVTYYDTKDAFTAIENGSKLRKPDELPFDLCFGGRRQFCQTTYSDLDSNREYDPLPAKGKFHALDFDTLLKQAQQSLKR